MSQEDDICLFFISWPLLNLFFGTLIHEIVSILTKDTTHSHTLIFIQILTDLINSGRGIKRTFLLFVFVCNFSRCLRYRTLSTLPGAVTCCDVSRVTGSPRAEAGLRLREGYLKTVTT